MCPLYCGVAAAVRRLCSAGRKENLMTNVARADGLGNVVRLTRRGKIIFWFAAPAAHTVLAVTEGFASVGGDGTPDKNGDGTGTLVLRLRS
jgi:hypothetical protein